MFADYAIDCIAYCDIVMLQETRLQPEAPANANRGEAESPCHFLTAEDSTSYRR